MHVCHSWKRRWLFSVSHWLCSKHRNAPASANISKRLPYRLINQTLTHLSMTYMAIDHSETPYCNKDNGAALQRGQIMKSNFTLEYWRKAERRESMKWCSLISSGLRMWGGGGRVRGGQGGTSQPLNFLDSDLSATAGINSATGKFGRIYIFQFI